MGGERVEYGVQVMKSDYRVEYRGSYTPFGYGCKGTDIFKVWLKEDPHKQTQMNVTSWSYWSGDNGLTITFIEARVTLQAEDGGWKEWKVTLIPGQMQGSTGRVNGVSLQSVNGAYKSGRIARERWR